MKISEKGQVVIIVAVLLMVILLLLAIIIDGTRLMVEQQELKRAAEAAGKAGLIVVGDRMVTQVVNAQTAAASLTLTATTAGSTPGPTLTETPGADDFYAWLTEDHRKTLIAPPMQTKVATYVFGSVEENGFGPNNPSIIGLDITYPDQYDIDMIHLQLFIQITRRVAIIFGRLLNLNEGVISGSTRQSIPQR